MAATTARLQVHLSLLFPVIRRVARLGRFLGMRLTDPQADRIARWLVKRSRVEVSPAEGG